MEIFRANWHNRQRILRQELHLKQSFRPLNTLGYASLPCNLPNIQKESIQIFNYFNFEQFNSHISVTESIDINNIFLIKILIKIY